MKTELSYRRSGSPAMVDHRSLCGVLVSGVAVIHSPESENPGIEIAPHVRVLGSNLLRELCGQIAEKLHLEVAGG